MAKKVTFSLSDEAIKKLAEISAEEKRKKSNIVELAIDDFYKKTKKS